MSTLRRRVPPMLVKYETVMGSMGYTQGIITASRPPPNASSRYCHSVRPTPLPVGAARATVAPPVAGPLAALVGVEGATVVAVTVPKAVSGVATVVVVAAGDGVGVAPGFGRTTAPKPWSGCVIGGGIKPVLLLLTAVTSFTASGPKLSVSLPGTHLPSTVVQLW